jgi:hypothetical protein
MSFQWPEFETHEPLAAGRSWTARFDSYDQYRENCYYRVSLFDAEQPIAEIMAEVGTEFVGDDWTSPEFTNELRARIARVAATSKSNTSYGG